MPRASQWMHGRRPPISVSPTASASEKIDRRFGAGDTGTLEALADGLDPWLHAAGFEPIEALDEVLC